MSKNDGGPAFPSVGEGFGNPQYSARGMSLRDYFAGQALAGVLANPNGVLTVDSAQHLPKVCWDLADALIAARENR